MKMQMGFICLVCFMMINVGVTRATICYESGNFTTNSTYEKNRNMILSSLASNVTLRDGFFYTATIGQEPDKVYALALCRGDSLLEECADCVSSSAKDIMRQCLNQKEAVAWGGTPQCIVRYSNRSIFGIMEPDPMAGGCEGNNINTTDTAQFNETWVSLMEGLVINASTGSNHPRRKFATGDENFSYFMKIYALLQCTPDISPSDCEDCLRQSIYYREDHDQGQTGCLIMRPSCIYMWGLGPFYRDSLDASSPSLPPSPPKIIPERNFTSNSTYEKNRNLVLSSLALNVTLHDGFFYTASVGQEPDKVYALALCRGDSSAEQCVSGVSFAAEDIMKQCLNQKEAVAWGQGPQCIVRYSDRSIFGKMEADPMAGGGYETDMTINMTQFDQTWESLMNRLLKKASTGSNNSTNKFATGEANLTDFVKIYALMQCTPDISESDCDSCLRQSVVFCESHYHGKAGCLTVRPSCIYRWDSSPFYVASPGAPSPSPPPQLTHKEMITKEKGGITSKTVFIIVVSTVIFVALVAFTCFLLWRRTRKTKRMMGGKRAIEDDDNVESLQFDFSTIRVATTNFSIGNKLGRGGFGVVYKAS